MSQIIVVNIKRLKDQLSAYLREVKAGKIILTTERGVAVAELRSPTSTPSQDARTASVYSQWVSEGRLIPPSAEKRPLATQSTRVPRGAAQALLDRDREQ